MYYLANDSIIRLKYYPVKWFFRVSDRLVVGIYFRKWSIITEMDFPWLCSYGHENMIDLEHLAEWPVDQVTKAQGFTCVVCGSVEAISYRTASLEAAERKLSRYSPGQAQFSFLFVKLVRKTQGLNQRGDH